MNTDFPSGLLDELRQMQRRQGRRVWRNGQRVHVPLRRLDDEEWSSLGPTFEQRVGVLRGVGSARLQPALDCLVVEIRVRRRRGETRDQAFARLEEVVVAAVADVEAELGLAQRPFATAQCPERHPGDWMPALRAALEVGLHVGSIGAGALLRGLGMQPRGVHVDMMAALSVVKNTPALRHFIEAQLTPIWTEIGLELSSATLRSLLQGRFGATVSALNRVLRLRENQARRKTWEVWEPRLCAVKVPRCERPAPRPCALPDGPIERYSNKASLGAMASFFGALFATGDVQNSTAAIFAGMPRQARVGRQAFASHVAYRLAREGVMVMAPDVLRHLDRLDCVALPQQLLQESPQDAAVLLETIRNTGLQAVITGCKADDAMGSDQQRLVLDGADAVHALQRDGHGVMFIARAPSDGPAAADCGIGLWREGDDPAPGAHLHCEGGLAQATAFVQLVAAARRAAEESMTLALAEVVVAVVLASKELKQETARRIASSDSALAVLAIADGLRLAQQLDWPTPVPQLPTPQWHAMTTTDAIASLSSHRDGLAEQEAAPRRAIPTQRSRLRALVAAIQSELDNPMTPILAAGAGLSLLAGGKVDAALVTAVLGINTGYGALQRVRAGRLLGQLAQHDSRRVRTRRNRNLAWVDEQDLVAGDVIELAAGDVVPADCRILEAHCLELDESGMTGESQPVAKHADPTPDRELAERHSMLYAGTVVATGQAVALVVAVGKATEAGRAALLQAVSGLSTGVEARLQQLTRLSAPVAGASGLLLGVTERLRGRPLDRILSTAVSLAVAAVPEGLPLLAALAQLSVARRLSHQGALVRNPRAVEALGRMDLLCADKTGTLTEGRLRLMQLSDGERDWQAGASGQRPAAIARRLLAVALRATPEHRDGAHLAFTADRALAEYAQLHGIGSHDGLRGWQRLHELPFHSDQGFHASLARHEAAYLISVKGAPERVLERCSGWQHGRRRSPLHDASRERLLARAETMAARGYRVLAVAERAFDDAPPLAAENLGELDFIGFVAFADPVRPSAREAVAELKRAGIETVMLTGDHPQTAAAIAHELGLNGGRRVMTGSELAGLDDDQLQAGVEGISVFARVSPSDKVRIVKAFQRCGRVVGMTGDGTNDAPAIRLAEVGIALGEGSTPAAREASDLIVPDGRIETILGAVIEGRALWYSIRDAVSLLIGGNLGEIGFTLAGGLAGEAPLNARQLLLVNLLTDTIPALAVALRPASSRVPEDLLTAGPETSLGAELHAELAGHAAATSAAALAAYTAARRGRRPEQATTVGLVALTAAQMLQVLSVSEGSRAVRLSGLGSLAALLTVVQTPGLSQFFGCRPLGPRGLFQAATAAMAGGAVRKLLPGFLRRRSAGSDAAAADVAAAHKPDKTAATDAKAAQGQGSSHQSGKARAASRRGRSASGGRARKATSQRMRATRRATT